MKGGMRYVHNENQNNYHVNDRLKFNVCADRDNEHSKLVNTVKQHLVSRVDSLIKNKNKTSFYHFLHSMHDFHATLCY